MKKLLTLTVISLLAACGSPDATSSNFNAGLEKYTYESDINGPSIVHYKMLRGGHWWDYSLDNDLKTSSLLWDFFSKHSRE